MLGGVSLNVRSGRLQHRHRSQRVWLCVALRWISSNEVDYALLYSCFMTFYSRVPFLKNWIIYSVKCPST